MGLDAYLTGFNESSIDPSDFRHEPEALKEERERVSSDRSKIDGILAELLGRRGFFRRRVTVPTPVMGADDRALTAQIGYESLQRLRALAAHIEFSGGIPTGEEQVDGTYLERIYQKRLRPKQFAHLILHSDCDGYYIPVDFEEPIERADLSCGSIPRLQRELDLLGSIVGAQGRWDEESRAASDSATWNYEWRGWAILEWLCRTASNKNLSIAFSG